MSKWTLAIDLDEMTPAQAQELLRTVDDFLDDFDPVARLTLTAKPVQDLVCPKCGSHHNWPTRDVLGTPTTEGAPQ